MSVFVSGTFLRDLMQAYFLLDISIKLALHGVELAVVIVNLRYSSFVAKTHFCTEIEMD